MSSPLVIKNNRLYCRPVKAKDFRRWWRRANAQAIKWGR